jgi:uncharacterized protein with LGFP repeats
MPMTAEKLKEVQGDLLCSAFEGGSNYWYRIEGYEYPKGKTRQNFEYPHIEVPLAGGVVKVKDMTDGEKGKVYRLTKTALWRGWETMRDKYVHHYADAVSDGGDAITGDVYLQCCLFGEVIYG